MSESLAEFFVGLGLDVDEKKWAEADKLVEQLGGKLKSILAKGLKIAAGAAALAAGALTKWSRDVLIAADASAKLAQQIGITTEQVQELEFAAKLAGASTADINTAFRRLGKNAVDAADGTGAAKDAFRDLGIEVTDASGEVRGQMELFDDIAEALGGVENETKKVAFANDLLGRSGAKLLPLFNQGPEGLKKAREEARKFGLVISGETAKAMEEFNDDTVRVRAQWDGFKNQLVVGILPTIHNVVRGILSWLDANRSIIQQRIDVAVEKITGAVESLQDAWERLDRFVEEKLGGWPAVFRAVAGAIAAAGLIQTVMSLRKALLLLAPLLGGVTVATAILAIKVIIVVAAFVLLAVAIDDVITGLQGGESYTRDFLDTWEETPGIIGSAIEWFKQLWELVKGLAEFVGTVLGVAFEVWWTIAEPWLTMLFDALKAIANFFLGEWLESIQESTSGMEDMTSWLEKATEKVESWREGMLAAADAVREKVEMVVGAVRSLAEWIGKLPLGKIADAAGMLTQPIVNPAGAVADAAGNFFGGAKSFVFGDTNVETHVTNPRASAGQIAGQTAAAVGDVQQKRLQMAFARLEGGEM